VADSMDSTNVELEPQQIYYNYAIPLPPTTTITNIDGTTSTVVVNINGASGPSITISAGSTGYEFNTSGSTITLVVDNAATVRSSISAAKSGINTDITELNGASQVDVSSRYEVSGVQVVQQRDTGWTAPTGTGSKAGYDTSTATLTQVAETLKELIDQVFTHGLIGT
jgi:hypothetical protein